MGVDTNLTVIAVCLLVLVIFAIIAIIYLIQLLIVVKKTTQLIEKKVNPLLENVKNIVNLTSEATECIRTGVEVTAPLFQSIKKISGLFQKNPVRFRSEMHDNTINITLGSSKPSQVDLGDWAEWIALGIVLIQSLRKKSK